MQKKTPIPLVSHPISAFAGRVCVPGDKSISHRSLIIGALAEGETRIHDLLEAEDILSTSRAMAALGAEIYRDDEGIWHVIGRGIGGLREPETVLDFGNAGTGSRLVMGVCAGHGFTSFIAGDQSLHKRPMARITGPLEQMGARFMTRSRGRLPIAVQGVEAPTPISFALPVASAQIKSAILLCGLMSPGVTEVVESEHTRDHTEHMLRHFGAEVDVLDNQGKRTVRVKGKPQLRGQKVVVPGDPSSAAFIMALSAAIPGSCVTIRTVLLNNTRNGFMETLQEMGARIEVGNYQKLQGEDVADITVHGAERLQGCDVPVDRAARMIDEYPILSVLAAVAEGTTSLNGVAELRHKESDRVAIMAEGLRACGVELEEHADRMVIQGTGGPIPGAGTVKTAMDHRIAMSFMVAGALAKAPITIDDSSFIGSSFPNFVTLMNSLGCRIVGLN